MRYIFVTLLAISNVWAIDCANFTNESLSMNKEEKVEAANKCKDQYIERLEDKIKLLDKSTNNCQEEIITAKMLIDEAKEFYQTATKELVCEHPDPVVEERIQDSMIDLTYALSDRVQERKCNHLDYVEAKADAQVNIILLEQTKVNSAQDA